MTIKSNPYSLTAAVLFWLAAGAAHAHPHAIGTPLAETAHLHGELIASAIGLVLVGVGAWRFARARMMAARRRGA